MRCRITWVCCSIIDRMVPTGMLARPSPSCRSTVPAISAVSLGEEQDHLDVLRGGAAFAVCPMVASVA
jgi:hypothetical protein